jgi:hypothetical protein
MEEEASLSGQLLSQLSKEKLEVLWESAKKREREDLKRELKS